MSPAGYTQAAPRTGDLTPLPWQRLVKSPGAGRLLQRGVRGWERGRQRRGPPAPLPAGPRNELWPRQRRRLRLTPVLPAVPVPPRSCHHARQGVPHLHAAHHRGGERGASSGALGDGGVVVGVSYSEQRQGIGSWPERDTVTPSLSPRGAACGRERAVLASGCSVRGLSRTLGCRWGNILSLGTATSGHRARRQARGTAGPGDGPAGEGHRGFGWHDRDHKLHPCSGREPECHGQTALTASLGKGLS